MGATFCSSGSRGLQPSRSIKALIGTWRERSPSAPRNSRGQCSPVLSKFGAPTLPPGQTDLPGHGADKESVSHPRLRGTASPGPFYHPSILPFFHSSDLPSFHPSTLPPRQMLNRSSLKALAITD